MISNRERGDWAIQSGCDSEKDSRIVADGVHWLFIGRINFIIGFDALESSGHKELSLFLTIIQENAGLQNYKQMVF